MQNVSGKAKPLEHVGLPKYKISKLRNALSEDLGFDDRWDDDEIETMAVRTIKFLKLIKGILADQERRKKMKED